MSTTYEVVCQHWFENRLGFRNGSPVIVHARTADEVEARRMAERLRVERHLDGEVYRWTSADVRVAVLDPASTSA